MTLRALRRVSASQLHESAAGGVGLGVERDRAEVGRVLTHRCQYVVEHVGRHRRPVAGRHLDDHLRAADPAAQHLQPGEALGDDLALLDGAQQAGGDGGAGVEAAGEAGCRRQVVPVAAPRCSQGADAGLADAGLDEGMAHVVLGGGEQARPVLTEVVHVGAAHQRPARVGRELADDPVELVVEVGLAEEAAVDGVGEVAVITELGRLHQAQLPAEGVGRAAYPLGGGARHGGCHGVGDDRRVRRRLVRDVGQQQAVDPTAARDDAARMVGERVQ